MPGDFDLHRDSPRPPDEDRETPYTGGRTPDFLSEDPDTGTTGMMVPWVVEQLSLSFVAEKGSQT